MTDLVIIVLALLVMLLTLVAIELHKAFRKSEEDSRYKVKLASWVIDQNSKGE
jgi:hypothetical protein